jgi:hypothetical protein
VKKSGCEYHYSLGQSEPTPTSATMHDEHKKFTPKQTKVFHHKGFVFLGEFCVVHTSISSGAQYVILYSAALVAAAASKRHSTSVLAPAEKSVINMI